MTPIIIYCFDAYCGWCYGFSPVIERLEQEYRNEFAFEVLSGGMIPDENPKPIAAMAGYISKAYKRVEEMTGVKFGDDFLWHIFNPDKSDWFPESTTPATALYIFKSYLPEKGVELAGEIQRALHIEGRDLTDPEAYRHLVLKYGIPEDEFFARLKTEKEGAQYEFALVKQLQVTGFPSVLMQVSETKFYLLAQGYTAYEDVRERIERIKNELERDTAL